MAHAGRLLSLTETSLPYELSPTLDTVGRIDFGGLPTGFTAHPKIDPRTQELHGFAYWIEPPHVLYHVVDAGGRLVRSVPVETAGPVIMHDFALTERHAVFFDLPVLFRMDWVFDGEHPVPYAWDDDYRARVGVLPRRGANASVRWFDIEPCYVFHTLNAYDDDHSVVVDVVRYDDFFRDGKQDRPLDDRPTLGVGHSTSRRAGAEPSRS